MARFTDFITRLIRKRISLSMIFALQILLLKAMRIRPTTVVLGLMVVAHVVGMHIGYCPLKGLRPCQYLTK